MHSSENSTPNSSTDSPLYYKVGGNTNSSQKCIFQTYDAANPQDITAKDVWYHGELNEHDANHLLQGTTPGAFLVRQTGNTRFYLSIVDPDGYPKHMP